MSSVSVLIPAHNEAGYVGGCLQALLASTPVPDRVSVEILVLANGCTDDTAAIAQGFAEPAAERGWDLRVMEIERGGKLNALSEGDQAASGAHRIYLDADVRVDPPLLCQLCRALAGDGARYASGSPRIAEARSRVTRAYARFWRNLPFVANGVPGFGVFAMNAAGRDSWRDWPDIISDDTFARLNFEPGDRIRVEAGYSWPMVEGFANLVRVRRRQNLGVAELSKKFPHLVANDDKINLKPGQLLGLALRDPIGFLVYAAVAIAVRTPLFASEEVWARGR